MHLSCTVYRYGELFVEIRLLRPTPPAFGAPLGVIPFEFRKDSWRQKSRVPWLSCSIVCVIVRFAVLVVHQLVTDTDKAMAYIARAELTW